MKTMLLGVALAGGLALLPGEAQAQYGPYGAPYGQGYGYGGGYCPAAQPYIPPVHYHPVFHPTGYGWNPHQGWHVDGHIDQVPHYGPGHFGPYYGGNPHYGHQH